MHGGDANADDDAAQHRVGTATAEGREPQAKSGHDNGNGQRGQRQDDVIDEFEPGMESQHGDEMRRPDAGPRRHGGHGEPDHPGTALGSAHLRQKNETGKGAEGAYNGGHGHQTQVVRRHQRDNVFEHLATRALYNRDGLSISET